MKAPHLITCAAPLALLFLGAACQAPSAAITQDSTLVEVQGAGAKTPAQAAASTAAGRGEDSAPKAMPSASSAASAAQAGAGADDQEENAQVKPKPATGKGKSAGKSKPKESPVENLAKQVKTAKEATVKAERERRYAEAELEIAEMGAAGTEIEVVESLRSARVDFEAAKEALEVFDSIERPLGIQKAEMSVSDAEERLLTAQTDMVGLEDIFAEETEASAKPEILRRQRRKVERAQRALDLAKKEELLKTETELPAQLRDLSGKVRAKEAALASATNGAAKERRSADLSVEKATDTAVDKKREARKAAAKVKSLEKRLNDVRQKTQGSKQKSSNKK